jgi:hypothetical protein
LAKYYGKIGFAEIAETGPGIYTEQIIERPYYGDLVRNVRKLQGTDQLNDNINIANEISIVADPYANDHFHTMRYVEFQGAKWKVSNVEVKFPRLILTAGGLYNG